MDLRTIVILSILISISGCTLAERFQKKIGQNQNEAAASPESPSAQPNIPAQPQPSDIDRIKQVIIQQQQQIHQLEASQEQDRIALERLEQKLITNFELLERSVSDSLDTLEQRLQKLTVAFNQQTSLSRQQNAGSPSSASPRSSRNQPDSPSENQETGRQMNESEESEQLIEDYSLVSSEETVSPPQKEEILPPREEQQKEEELAPLPPRMKIKLSMRPAQDHRKPKRR